MVRIPLEYQEVEYLESNGTQWIDTGIIPTTETVSQLKFLVPEYNGDVIYGFFDAEATDYRFFIYNGIFMFDLGGFRIQSISDERRNKIYEIELGNYHIKDLVTNTFYATTTKKGVSATCTITLNNYKNTRFSKCRWYYVKIYEDTELVRNFTPCYRKSDSEPGMYDTVSGTFYTNSGSGTFLVGNDVSWDAASLLERRRQILLNTPHIETVSGSMASFNTDISANLKECKVYFSPVQEGTGDPSPDNVRPISGWNGVTITKPSKNLISFDYCTHLSRSWVNGGVIKNTSSYDLYAFPIPKNTMLTLSRNNNYGSIGCVCSVATEDAVIGKQHLFGLPTMTNRQYYTFNSGEGTWLWFSIVNSQDVSIYEWQLEVGSGRTSYEAPTTLTIPFDHTIYGGYVDLLKGEVVEEYEKFQMDGTESNIVSYDAGNTTHRFALSVSALQGQNKIVQGNLWISDMFLFKGGVRPFGSFNFYYTQNIVFADGNNDIADVATLRQWFSENTPSFVAPLATPNTYTLTPETIKALKGINNIWSNANGNIEVSYYTH